MNPLLQQLDPLDQQSNDGMALRHCLWQLIRRWRGGVGMHSGKYLNQISSLQDLLQVV